MAKIIYHYTSGNALKRIVETKKIWFSDIRCMNDYGEQKLFTQAIIKESILEQFKDMIQPEIYETYESGMVKQVETALSQYRCFILSCSLNDDSLPMWNYYSKGDAHGGYNIGFDVEKIVKHINKNIIEKIDGSLVLFGKVAYCNSDGIIRECLSNCFKFIVGKIRELPEETIEKIENVMSNDVYNAINNSVIDEFKLENGRKQEFINKWREYIQECQGIDLKKNKIATFFYRNDKKEKDYFNINNFIKTGDFAYEKEFRIAIMIPNNKVKEVNNILNSIKPYKTRYQNGMYVPYLEIEIPKETFVSVKIAPTNFTMKPEENLSEFLADNDIDAIVDKSKITVRY